VTSPASRGPGSRGASQGHLPSPGRPGAPPPRQAALALAAPPPPGRRGLRWCRPRKKRAGPREPARQLVHGSASPELNAPSGRGATEESVMAAQTVPLELSFSRNSRLAIERTAEVRRHDVGPARQRIRLSCEQLQEAGSASTYFRIPLRS